MRKLLPILSALVLASLAPAAASAATAAPATAPSAALATPSVTGAILARRGFGSSRGYGRRYGSRPGYGSRRGYGRPYRRGAGRRFFGGVLKALGVAYLFHMLFGWGAGGGSPIMLFVILGLVMWILVRRRRRSPYGRPSY
ncbi:MAG TPA: hypothetical protein VF533_19335 [Solirubrobacteraceae bacterium]|jgi:hypothetical protein